LGGARDGRVWRRGHALRRDGYGFIAHDLEPAEPRTEAPTTMATFAREVMAPALAAQQPA
jgi:hypothetical protein